MGHTLHALMRLMLVCIYLGALTFFVGDLCCVIIVNNYCRGAGFFSCVFGGLVVTFRTIFGVKLYGSGARSLHLLLLQLRRRFISNNVRAFMFVLG